MLAPLGPPLPSSPGRGRRRTRRVGRVAGKGGRRDQFAAALGRPPLGRGSRVTRASALPRWPCPPTVEVGRRPTARAVTSMASRACANTSACACPPPPQPRRRHGDREATRGGIRVQHPRCSARRAQSAPWAPSRPPRSAPPRTRPGRTGRMRTLAHPRRAPACPARRRSRRPLGPSPTPFARVDGARPPVCHTLPRVPGTRDPGTTSTSKSWGRQAAAAAGWPARDGVTGAVGGAVRPAGRGK